MLLVFELQLQMRARFMCNRRSFDPSAAAETLLITSPSKPATHATRNKDQYIKSSTRTKAAVDFRHVSAEMLNKHTRSGLTRIKDERSE